ncbi:hypothetical protein AAMO2058_001695400 [Amorphochlora amoebiformis]
MAERRGLGLVFALLAVCRASDLVSSSGRIHNNATQRLHDSFGARGRVVRGHLRYDNKGKAGCASSERIFDAFVLHTYSIVSKWQVNAAVPLSTSSAAVIVETRPHRYFQWVVKDVMHYLGEGWALYVFHGSQNGNHVRSELEGHKNVQFVQATIEGKAVDDFNQLTYGDFVMRPEFWSQFPANVKRVLIFQTDSCALRPYSVEEATAWSKFDYIGSPWDFNVPRMQMLTGTAPGAAAVPPPPPASPSEVTIQALNQPPEATVTPPATSPIASPPDAAATPPATAVTPPATAMTPPAAAATPPATAVTPPATAMTPPAAAATPPATAVTPPATAATPPATAVTPPATDATPQDTAATPPATAVTPPATAATPPATAATPPVAAAATPPVAGPLNSPEPPEVAAAAAAANAPPPVSGKSEKGETYPANAARPAASFDKSKDLVKRAQREIGHELAEMRDVVERLKHHRKITVSTHPYDAEEASNFAEISSSSWESAPMYYSGNGGFSLRSTRASVAMIECARQRDVRENMHHFEDQIFILCFLEHGFKVANHEEAKDFSLESLGIPPLGESNRYKPFGMHQAYCFQPDADFARVLVTSQLAKDTGFAHNIAAKEATEYLLELASKSALVNLIEPIGKIKIGGH